MLRRGFLLAIWLKKRFHPGMKFIPLDVSCYWKASPRGRYVLNVFLNLWLICPNDVHPVQEHLFDIEEQTQTSASDKPYYIVYPDEFGGNWRIQAVPNSPDSFESRKALPEQCAMLFSIELCIKLIN